MQSITVSGNARYTSEEIIAASGIEIEDNLFLLNKYNAAQAIFEKLPYVEEATINRALPDTIVITVRECAAAAGVAAMRAGAVVITDTNMALAGITKPGLKKLNGEAICYMADPAVAEAIAGKTIAKEIYVKGRLVNIAVKG